MNLDETAKAKKPYHPPALRVYGNLRDLTHSTLRSGRRKDRLLGRLKSR
jgi:hypothetical protein